MKRMMLAPLLAVLSALFVPTAAHAGEALPQLKGEWIVEIEKGKDISFDLAYHFKDDETLVLTLTWNDKKQVSHLTCRATKEGIIAVNEQGIHGPNEDKGTWEIKEGKLYITTGRMGTVLTRKAEPES